MVKYCSACPFAIVTTCSLSMQCSHCRLWPCQYHSCSNRWLTLWELWCCGFITLHLLHCNTWQLSDWAFSAIPPIGERWELLQYYSNLVSRCSTLYGYRSWYREDIGHRHMPNIMPCTNINLTKPNYTSHVSRTLIMPTLGFANMYDDVWRQPKIRHEQPALMCWVLLHTVYQPSKQVDSWHTTKHVGYC
jgi:hypothetical protein